MSDSETLRGWKFLDPTNSTEYGTARTVYPVPGPGERWGPWFNHPSPVEPDGRDYGPGGWHMMLRLSTRYAPSNWWPWRAELRGVLGVSSKKARGTAIRLRRVEPRLWWRYIRRFGEGICLAGAVLNGATLGGAKLDGAWLGGASLEGAWLAGASLAGATLARAKLDGAWLGGASLDGAWLAGASLAGATLARASLRGAVLDDASLDVATLVGASLVGASLVGASLTGATLAGATADHNTVWPDGFDPVAAGVVFVDGEEGARR